MRTRRQTMTAKRRRVEARATEGSAPARVTPRAGDRPLGGAVGESHRHDAARAARLIPPQTIALRIRERGRDKPRQLDGITEERRLTQPRIVEVEGVLVVAAYACAIDRR